MLRPFIIFSALLTLVMLFHISGADAAEGHHTLGVQAGQVDLSSDVGTTYQNALGAGVFFDYAASDYLEFELSWLNSHHTGPSAYTNGPSMNLQQNAYDVALLYDFDQYDIFTPYLKGGAEFVTHAQDVALSGVTAPYTSTGFGLDIGVGCRIDFARNLMAGLDLYYHSMFTASVTPTGSNTSVNTIESYFTALLRFGFVFGSGDKAPTYKN